MRLHCFLLWGRCFSLTMASLPAMLMDTAAGQRRWCMPGLIASVWAASCPPVLAGGPGFSVPPPQRAAYLQGTTHHTHHAHGQCTYAGPFVGLPRGTPWILTELLATLDVAHTDEDSYAAEASIPPNTFAEHELQIDVIHVCLCNPTRHVQGCVTASSSTFACCPLKKMPVDA